MCASDSTSGEIPTSRSGCSCAEGACTMPAALQVLSTVVLPIATAAAAALALAIVFYTTRSVRYISNHRVGVVEKLWSRSGSVPGGLIALHGEAGYQPDVLRGGLHVFRPFQSRIH